MATCPAVSLSSMHGVSLRLGLPLSSHPSFSSPSSSSVTSFGDKKRGYGFVVSASTETSLAQTGVIFKPFEEVKKEDFMIPISRQISLARQRYHDECEAAINEQINVEYNVSYVYRAMYAYFDRDNVALKGLAKFFKESSDEEREMGSLIFIPALLLSGQTHDNIEKICSVYDSFLSEYPLCHGYWRKYAAHKAHLCTVDKVGEIFERAVQSATYCVGIWVEYCSFSMSAYEDPSDVRRLFKRAMSFVGKDYLCYPLWDKYIEFESSQQQWIFLAKIYVQTLKFPTKRLCRYYDKK
ncbi:unnamed protein product [Camellia sinensis]